MVQTYTDDGQTAQGDGSPIPLTIPDATELFDAFMVKIDPRFTHEGHLTLEQDLIAASPDERKRIADRYREALKEFEVWMKEYSRGLKHSLSQFRTTVETEGRELDLLPAESALDALIPN